MPGKKLYILILSDLVSPKSVPIHFGRRGMLNDLANTTQNQLDFNIVAEKTLRKQRYHSKYLCLFLSSFFRFFLLSLSLPLHCLDSKYL